MLKNKIKYLLTGLLISSALITTSCYNWYENKIDMDTESLQVNLNDFMYEAPEITELSCPTQVLASQGLYSGVIKIHWNAVPYARSYRIERAVMQADSNGLYATPEEGDFSVIEKYVYSTNYQDTVLSNPLTDSDEYQYKYYYRVSAENIKEGYDPSEFTDINNQDTQGLGWLLAPPKNIEAWKGKSIDSIQISWDSVENASQYQIYRGTKASQIAMVLLDEIKANNTSYLNEIDEDEKGQEFYYQVRALLANGALSAPTGFALGYSLTANAPAAPNNVKVTNGKSQSTDNLKITWDPVEKEGYTITYSVYRTSSESSIYESVKQGTSDTSCTDSNSLKKGLKYYYYVQTLACSNSDSTAIEKSAFSASGPNDASPAVGWLLSPPSSCEVADSTEEDKVKLRWTPAVGYDEEGITFNYNIYACQTLDGEFTLIDTISDLTSLTLDDDNYYSYDIIKNNFYRISTYNVGESMESDLGEKIAPSPSAPRSVTASKTSALDGLSNYSYNTNEVYPVKITWQAPENESPSGYNIYRSTKSDSGFRKINDDIVKDFSYLDENETARAGTVYYYKVISLNVLGQGNKGNDQDENSRGYGAITRDQWFREYNKSIMSSQAKLTLMHKSNDMDKLGSETINGDISGTLSYNAAIAGLGAEITMPYNNYCDFYIGNNSALGKYFVLTGNTDTTSNMSANGNMHGTVNCTGMYPGQAVYDNLQIKGGAAGGGYYLVTTKDLSGSEILSQAKVDWTVGEE
ncbi:MAG: fibronectin type III domain-containing protein [Treponema sp.]|nr:fibronectin type III domain-containing protein [Treponema sp.]